MDFGEQLAVFAMQRLQNILSTLTFFRKLLEDIFQQNERVDQERGSHEI